MKVLVLDNYDSFTYNLVQYLGELGAEVETVRNDRATVEELLERGYDGKIIAGSRHPEKLSFTGIEARKADFDSDASLDAAFKGVDRLLLISTDAMDEAGQRLRRGGNSSARGNPRSRIRRSYSVSQVAVIHARPTSISHQPITPTKNAIRTA